MRSVGKNEEKVPSEAIVLVLLILLGLLIAMLFYSGPFYSYDDANYIGFARQIMVGNFSVEESPYAYGFAFPYFIAASFWLFGYGIEQSFLVSLVSYIAIIIVAFFAGKVVSGLGSATISGFLAAIAPFLVQYSTRVMPDLLLGAFAGASLFLALYAEKSKRAALMYLLSGLLAGFTVFIKLEALAFVLFFFIGLLILLFVQPHKKTRRKHLEIFAIAALVATVGIYFAFIYAMTGNPLYTISRYGVFQHGISPTTLFENIYNLFVTLFGFTVSGSLFSPYTLSPIIYPYGFGIFFALTVSVIGIKRKSRKIILLSVVSWGFFLYMYFGTMSFSKYLFIAVITRYFSMISVPMSVLAALGIYSFYKIIYSYCKSCALLSAVLIIILIVLLSLPTYLGIYYYNKAIALDNLVIKCASSYLSESGTKVVYANAATELLALDTKYKFNPHQIGSSCNSLGNGGMLVYFYSNEGSLNQGLGSWLGNSCYNVDLFNCNPNESSEIYENMVINAEISTISRYS
ncbi:MAG: ArnT family glycosyltransferase [Candidatus Micrarchaeia archaeon]|jgi:4-amino-4-deoxy-L-arabinose transferase-like glycosyltransferase